MFQFCHRRPAMMFSMRSAPGSDSGNLPKKLSSSGVEKLLWPSVLPIRPILKGLTPSSAS